MSQQVDYTAFRYGAPSTVVDPLLSFLYDLRRMEDTVLSALTHLGVDRRRLPLPFGDDKGDGLAVGTSKNSSSGVKLSAGSAIYGDNSAKSSAAAINLFDAYVKSTLANGVDPTPADAYTAAQCVLAWLDEHQQQQSSMSPPNKSAGATAAGVTSSSPSDSLSRSLIAAFVAAGDTRDAFLIDTATEAEVHMRRPSKRHKKESLTKNDGAAVVPNSSGSWKGEGNAGRLFSLSAAEVYTAAEMSKRYEKLLRSGTKNLKATIHAVTTSDLTASYSCHAKWVEVTREESKAKCVFPSSKTLQKNYEHLIRLNDALATCQSAVHNAYVALEEHLDVFLDEAPVVAQAERAFQHCVAQASVECQGLQAMRKRLKRTRVVLEKASSLDAERSE